MTDHPLAVSPLGFGIIGLGMIADYHARAIAAARGGKLVAVASRSLAKAQAFAQKHGAAFATDDFHQLLARPDVDAVCITTPNAAHYEPALAAIRAGKHLVLEKPIEVTVERTDEIIAAAEQAGVKLAPIFQSRFGEGARRLKAALTAGRFGRLALCSAYIKWQRTPQYYEGGWHGVAALNGGGVAMNQAIHAIDLLQWFAGMPQEVFALAGRCVHSGIEGEDTLAATLHFAHGAFGTIEASTAVFPGWSQCLDLCGEHGSVRLEDDRLVRWDFREPRPEDTAIRAGAGDITIRSGAGAPNAIGIEGHCRQIQDLIDAVAENRPVAIPPREARNAIAIIGALYASAARRIPVRL
ncbi:Gfo/Idh/MocA family protein [Opitutus terrae]|uniref:Oxidoreductase domain protein n=1 Tax=Opitutus terrae (strain DSM 11246 / JCM 15787 / PB90-1) TaxID=452637 RepID=B1ZWQ9_OPITP|nr:Gfo/Idh/MocA family oxidoreductase [Opitutus terrae]ACB74186.1 oxidoreductase domain protein [Opitutus terrae PB90-1]